MGMMSGMMDQLKGLFEKLMGGGGGGGGGGSGGGGGGNTDYNNTNTCPSGYYQVTVPTSDPCAYYVPPVGGGNSTSQRLLDALNGGSGSVGDTIIDSLGGTTIVSSTTVTQRVNTATTRATSTGSTVNTAMRQLQGVQLQPGVRGNIEINDLGATLFGNIQLIQQNSEVGGFYGANTFVGSPQGLVAQLCANRPWARSFVSYIIPPSFFDSLCAWRGYSIGPPPVVSGTQTGSAPSRLVIPPKKTATTTKPAVSPERVSVEIWAEPSAVALGARTTIFWDTSGVSECSETSSDGNFSEATLSGGSATVPLTGATTFTITCLTGDGRTFIDNTTVNLAI